MSREAQAERERRARTILGLAETEIADKFSAAAANLCRQPGRSASPRYEHAVRGIKEKGSMIVPSSAMETIWLGGTLATTTLGKTQ